MRTCSFMAGMNMRRQSASSSLGDSLLQPGGPNEENQPQAGKGRPAREAGQVQEVGGKRGKH